MEPSDRPQEGDQEGDLLRVVYMGTPDFAVPALEALCDSRHEVVGVFTNPDRKSGRGKRVTPPPVKVAAEHHDVPVFQPKSAKSDASLEQLEAWAPDVVVVAAYGQILPPRILELPTYGCINIHASLLPKYRGAAPINWAIVEGETESGVTIMQMEEGLDTGPILEMADVVIPDDWTAQDLHDRLAELGAEMIVPALDALQAGRLEPTPQDDAQASYAPMLQKSNGRVDWSQPARRVADHIRGFNPWPGAFSFVQNDGQERVKFHRARVVTDAPTAGQPGVVLVADPSAGTLRIACGEGAIDVLEVQAPGRKAMDAAAFLNGYPLSAGDRFA